MKASCPEIMDLFIQSPLFQPTTSIFSGGGTTPESMASKFGVPYLGRLPMDPNMMNACERGESFLQAYAASDAAPAFAQIVNKIVEYTQQISKISVSHAESVDVEMDT
jgi:NUBPL iron-transfer P-loop NTPase